jgi:hypothetical protein
LRLGFALITSPSPGNYTAQDIFFVPTKKKKAANHKKQRACGIFISIRGNKTAIELFLADTRGWEAGVQRKLEDGKLQTNDGRSVECG